MNCIVFGLQYCIEFTLDRFTKTKRVTWSPSPKCYVNTVSLRLLSYLTLESSKTELDVLMR